MPILWAASLNQETSHLYCRASLGRTEIPVKRKVYSFISITGPNKAGIALVFLSHGERWAAGDHWQGSAGQIFFSCAMWLHMIPRSCKRCDRNILIFLGPSCLEWFIGGFWPEGWVAQWKGTSKIVRKAPQWTIRRSWNVSPMWWMDMW